MIDRHPHESNVSIVTYGETVATDLLQQLAHCAGIITMYDLTLCET